MCVCVIRRRVVKRARACNDCKRAGERAGAFTVMPDNARSISLAYGRVRADNNASWRTRKRRCSMKNRVEYFRRDVWIYTDRAGGGGKLGNVMSSSERYWKKDVGEIRASSWKSRGTRYLICEGFVRRKKNVKSIRIAGKKILFSFV